MGIKINRVGLIALIAGLWSVCVLAEESCKSAFGENAVQICRQQLAATPNDIDTRLKLADTLVDLARYEEAVTILNRGVMIYPGSEIIKNKLSTAKSFLNEQQWLEEKEKSQTNSAGVKSTTSIKLLSIRCTTLTGERALAACDEGLNLAPDDPELLGGKADVMLSLANIPEAILLYRKALSKDPDNEEISKNLQAAKNKRKVESIKCLSLESNSALKSCDQAILIGAEDEIKLELRRASLLAELGREKSALKSYKRVTAIAPKNKEAKSGIRLLEQRLEPEQILSTQAAVHTTNKPENETALASHEDEILDLPPSVPRFSNEPLAPSVTY